MVLVVLTYHHAAFPDIGLSARTSAIDSSVSRLRGAWSLVHDGEYGAEHAD
jgi:hypothetical protein